MWDWDIRFKADIMQRRDFIKSTCRICLLGTAGASALRLAACSPSAGKALMRPRVIDNTVTIPVSAFDKESVQIISPEKYPYEIAVQKQAGGSYKALLLKCTHYENALIPAGNGYYCNAHGSRFGLEGNVLKGPAAAPLTSLKTTLTQTGIQIHLTT